MAQAEESHLVTTWLPVPYALPSPASGALGFAQKDYLQFFNVA
jgi:hypothetical protein